MSPERAQLLAACVDAPDDRLTSGTLPPLWHWAFFVPAVPTRDLGPDGHPKRRAELDSVPQRMWVGGRVHVQQPLALGVPATRRSRIAATTRKDGRSGPFWLTTVAHEYVQRGAVAVTEEQDLVFRPPSTLPSPGPSREEAPTAPWVEEIVLDPVQLFRFSAVTNNAHRIHYDHPYATTVERYPGLVVHGPLTALLLADFAARRSERDISSIEFRARQPHFAGERCWLVGRADESRRIEVAAIRSDHEESMSLVAW